MMQGIEPSSDARQVANSLRQQYVALINEGFTEAEALRLLMTMITAGAQQQRP